MRSCRSERGSPDIWKASQGCVRPPSDAVCASSCHAGSASRRGFCGCAACIRVLPRLPAPSGCHIPCPGRGSEGSAGSVQALHDDGFDGGLQQLGVVNVGPVDHRAQGAAVFLDDHAAFRARLATIRGIWADFIPPKRALARAPSADCQSQLRPPSSSHSLTNAAQMRCITPSRFQR